MDKAILKKFAIESRKDLMEKIKNKINTFYIDEEFKKEQKGEIYVLSNEKHSLSLTNEEYQKRELLIKRIKELSLEQVIEEAAYTWFNRIIAIRYMEINDYLPLTKDNQSLGIRVLSSKDNTPDPEILKFTNLINPDLDIDFKKEKYIELKDDNEKFKYVLLLVCKKLGRVIPQVFDGITDYIDILIPDNLLNDTGFITKIINEVPEENYNQVEIIGWLYQFYNQEQKDLVMSSTSSKKTYSKTEIPFVTQLFTPDWVVKYMIENTLGRYAIEHGANKKLIDKWNYYINDNVEIKENISPIEIKFIDPCSGSGHILVYAFEIFYQIYESYGYNKSDIPELILSNNLYGLDVDDRAGQLSILSVLLKAREYDKAIFDKEIIKKMNIMPIQESNNIDNVTFDEISNLDIRKYLKDIFDNSKEIGSLLIVDKQDYAQIIRSIEKENNIFSYQLKERILPLIKQATILSNKYNIVVTNPPYLSLSVMGKNLKNYVNKFYGDYKYDLFSAFSVANYNLLKNKGYYAMITPPSILFLDTFEKTRKNIIDNSSIISLIHMGRGVFGIDFGSCSFVIKKEVNNEYESTFLKLYDRTFQYINNEDIEKIYLSSIKDNNFKYDFDAYANKFEDGITKKGKNIIFKKNQNMFRKLPNLTFSYWLSNNVISLFNNKNISDYADVKQGMTTGNNNLFLRLWYEVEKNKIGFGLGQQEAISSDYKWFPYNKGGDFRKWYGNNEYLVNYENNGKEVKEYTSHLPQGTAVRIKSYDYYFKESATWSFISSNNFGIRYSPKGFIFDVAGSSLFSEKYLYYIIGLLSTNMVNNILKSLNPTVNFQTKNIKTIPAIYDVNSRKKIEEIVKENIFISKEDWDSFETSWDFKVHPLIKEKEKFHYGEIGGKEYKLSDCYNHWQDSTEMSFNKLKENEEKLNEIFIDIYGLKDELTPEVEDKDITIRKADKEREIKSLISYAVGCMFGRYSLDKEGLIYAGGDFDEIYKKCKKTDGGWAGVSLSNYKVLNDNGQEIDLSFEVDNDNVIPITDEAYFSDDIVERFKTFISVVYGEKTLNENLDFIAETLGKKGTETSEDTIRRYFVNDFFNDHVKTYQKRPIYWLFDSGKKNGFKALVYMHRYNENLIPKVRLDYLHRMQTTYEKLLVDVNDKLTSELSMTDKKEAQKRQADLNAKLQEIKEYDEKIAHIANQRISIDLDDGVKVNYDKFKDILAKIK